MIKVRLAELLKEKKRSRYWLAKKTGLTPLTITKIFKGETGGIDYPTLDAICDALECQTNDVIVFQQEEKNKEARK